MFVLLASLVLGACSSSDDDNNVNDPKNAAYTETTVTEAPAWQIDWSNNQERPNWTEPDGSLYANWTILKVQIEDALKAYASDGDLMALFVNGEIRALAKPAVSVGGGTATGKFLMKAYGNETGSETVNMSLQYYSQTLKHLFTLTDNITLDSDVTTGIDEAFVPEFTLGSAKYPVQKTVGVELLLNKVAIDTDLLISEGFIEPHFFAGFSGGRKSVLPGVASRATVMYNHNAGFIASARARTGVLETSSSSATLLRE